MEDQLELRIKQFLQVGDGDGSGDGSGYGDGITEFKGQKVWLIDGLPTIIEYVGSKNCTSAMGFILNKDFTLTPCYIAKVGNCFAHGDTLHKAFDDAMKKALENMPIEQRIVKFKEQFPDSDVKIPARQLYNWHHTLTGSCQMGRDNFARQHSINVDKDAFTVREFITLTKDAYGFDAIRKLAEAYNIKIR